jgi:hypothetical protein
MLFQIIRDRLYLESIEARSSRAAKIVTTRKYPTGDVTISHYCIFNGATFYRRSGGKWALSHGVLAQPTPV